MTEPLPDPLVPPEVDLRGYEFMPYYGDRLRDSDLNSRATDAEYRAAHNLWWSAWKQVPAASLPDDDTVLARLADLGRDLKSWQKVRDVALRGFIKCSDGRFYHKVLSPLAIEAFEFRNTQRNRTEAARKAKLLQKQLQEQSQSLSQTQSKSVTDTKQPEKSPVTDSTGQDRTGQDIKTTARTPVEIPNSATTDPPAARAAPSPEKDAPTLRGAMAKILREEGVTINPSNPFLVKWIECGVTVQHARTAVYIARERKPKPANIPPAYLDPIIAQVMSGNGVKSAVTSTPKVDTTCRRILAGGVKCGMPGNAHPIHGFSCSHCNRKDEELRVGKREVMPAAVREALNLSKSDAAKA